MIFNLAGRPNGCCNMWAPEFHLLNGPNGRWYLYYVAGQNVPDYNPTQRLHVLEIGGHRPDGPVHVQGRPRQHLGARRRASCSTTASCT